MHEEKERVSIVDRKRFFVNSQPCPNLFTHHDYFHGEKIIVKSIS